MSEELFEVVYPLGVSTMQTKNVAPSLDTLNGKKVGLYWNHAFRGEYSFPIVKRILQEKFPDVTIIDHTEFPDATSGAGDSATAERNLEKLCRMLKQQKVDALILGNGC